MKISDINQLFIYFFDDQIKSNQSFTSSSKIRPLLPLLKDQILMIVSFVFFAQMMISDLYAQEQPGNQQTNTSTTSTNTSPSKKMKIKGKANQVQPQVQVLKETLESIRYEKDDQAIASFAIDAQGQRLLGETWGQATQAQRKSFVESFSVIFKKMAFNKIRSNLRYLEDTVIGETQHENGVTRQKVTLVILHELKKEEIVLYFEMQLIEKTWKIVDIQVEKEDSFVKKIREDQILPILKQDGLDGLIKALQERAGQINAK